MPTMTSIVIHRSTGSWDIHKLYIFVHWEVLNFLHFPITWNSLPDSPVMIVVDNSERIMVYTDAICRCIIAFELKYPFWNVSGPENHHTFTVNQNDFDLNQVKVRGRFEFGSIHWCSRQQHIFLMWRLLTSPVGSLNDEYPNCVPSISVLKDFRLHLYDIKSRFEEPSSEGILRL